MDRRTSDAHAGLDRRRAMRREILEIRTITISLRSAMHDLGGDRSIPGRRRMELRREWCERASRLLAQVEKRWRAAIADLGPTGEDAIETAAVGRLIESARRDVEEFELRVA